MDHSAPWHQSENLSKVVMKVVILAGGFGTRLSEETVIRPKPMVEIGEEPILWHIMKIYSHFGFSDFVILLGYKGYYIKEYFANYLLHRSNVTIDLNTNSMDIHDGAVEPWRVTLLDTGLHSMTGGRIRKAKDIIGNNRFMLTYGDGVADIDIPETIRFHDCHKGLITMTSVQPEGRFGALSINTDNRVVSFAEKPKGDNSWINGGFFVCEPRVFDYIENDVTVFEDQPLQRLAADQQLHTYKHKGFWKCMDTKRDHVQLNAMWDDNKAPWKIWSE